MTKKASDKDLVTMALSKAISPSSKIAKEARAALTPGVHSVNEMVRLTGDLVVSEDGERSPTSSLLSVDFMLMVLHRCGVTRDSAMSVISEIAEEYLVDWTGSKEDKKKAKEARKKALAEYDPNGKGKAIFEDFKGKLPKTPTKGAVKFEGTVETVKIEKAKDPVVVVEEIA
jgi:hypothetical protein